MRDRYCPERKLPVIMPSIIGVRKVPLDVAVCPRTPWKNKGIYMMPVNMPKPVRNITTVDTATIGFRNIQSGMIGSLTCLSIFRNTNNMTIENTNKPTI